MHFNDVIKKCINIIVIIRMIFKKLLKKVIFEDFYHTNFCSVLLWKHYIFIAVSSTIQADVRNAIAEIEQKTCVSFQEYNDNNSPKNFIRFWKGAS